MVVVVVDELPKLISNTHKIVKFSRLNQMSAKRHIPVCELVTDKVDIDRTRNR